MAEMTQDGRLLAVETPLGKDVLLINRVTGVEGISSLFSFRIECLAENSKASAVKAESLIGQSIDLAILQSDDSRRYINGIVSSFSQGRQDKRFTYFHLQMVPWLWLLTQSAESRIYQDLSVPDIVKKVFGDLGYSDFRMALTKDYTPWDYCVQYRETHFNFVSRMLEQEGMFYFFEHSKGHHVLVIADSPDVHQDCPVQSRAIYAPGGGRDKRGLDMVTSWTAEKSLRPGKYALRDFHFQMPSKNLEMIQPSRISVDGNSRLELYDYPGEYAQLFNKPEARLGKVEPEGEKAIRRRMEEEEVRYEVVRASSTCRSFITGFRFSLAKHYDSQHDDSYVLISIDHQGSQFPPYVSSAGQMEMSYASDFVCIPHRVPFRPQRKTPKPVVQGLQTAMVTGPKGEEIYPDKFGRVKVQFHWDREGKRDENTSAWVRVSQDRAGKSWGAWYLPRIGDEVVVAFLEGDPDQPLITGSVYNAHNMPPYVLPDNKTQTGIKTRSSKGGSTSNFNELRFEDKKGSEQVFLHGEKDLDVVIKNDRREWIGNTRHLMVVNSRYDDIGAESHLKVASDENAEVGGDSSKKVDGNVAVEIGGSHVEKAGQEIYLNAGSKVVIEAPDITLKGAGGFVRVNATGVTVQGTLVKINSGGSPGKGKSKKPKKPDKPAKAAG